MPRPTYTSAVTIRDYAHFTATVDALGKLYPKLSAANCIASSRQIFTDIAVTRDENGRTLTDIYGKQVASDIIGALIRHTAYGFYLSRPVLVVS